MVRSGDEAGQAAQGGEAHETQDTVGAAAPAAAAVPAVARPLRRAVVLVPGFRKRPRMEAAGALAAALACYAEGMRCLDDPGGDRGATPGTPQGMGDRLLRRLVDRETGREIELTLFEGYWFDLVPEAPQTPWLRVSRGASLIGYWFLGGVARAMVVDRRWPPVILLGFLWSGLLLLVWYGATLALFAKAVLAQDPTLSEAQRWLLGTGWPAAALQAVAPWLDSALVGGWLLSSALFARAEKTAALAAFAKAYLQDQGADPTGPGLRAEIRARVTRLLDEVAADPGFDDIHVVGHSFGGMIALDAVAGYGRHAARIVLHSWGSALGLFALQEPMVVAEIAKLHGARTPVAGWIEVAFRSDTLASAAPLPRGADGGPQPRHFPPLRQPPVPKGVGWSALQVHDAYFRSEEVIGLLVAPLSAPAPAP
ncbi:hypothetical protein [Frigidibacter sp. MR17.24]|uniref:hypothetical protein n=1 Tax=Frigidibacter sp. MR17.24 TaxID=3127345 RepID=UPI003012BE60